MRKYRFILPAAVILFLGLVQPSQAVTSRVTAHIHFGGPAVIKKTAGAQLVSVSASDPTLFMDTYGKTYIQDIAGAAGRPGIITVQDSSNQFMNFLTSDPQSYAGLELMKVLCSLHRTFDNDCNGMLSPASHDIKTLYIGMHALMKDVVVVADASPSIDVTVVYQ